MGWVGRLELAPTAGQSPPEVATLSPSKHEKEKTAGGNGEEVRYSYTEQHLPYLGTQATASQAGPAFLLCLSFLVSLCDICQQYYSLPCWEGPRSWLYLITLLYIPYSVCCNKWSPKYRSKAWPTPTPTYTSSKKLGEGVIISASSKAPKGNQQSMSPSGLHAEKFKVRV